MKVASGAWVRAACSRFRVPVALTEKSVCGSLAAQSCEGCAAVWMTTARSRGVASEEVHDAIGVADVELGGPEAVDLVDELRPIRAPSNASGPRKYARMSFSTPMTSKPRSAKWRTDSEPMRPPEPVTMAMGMGVR